MAEKKTTDSRPRWIGAGISSLFHAVLIGILLIQLQVPRGNPSSPPARHKMLRITYVKPRPPPKPAPPPAQAKPVDPPKEPPQVSPLPTPPPVAKPKPAPRPARPTPSPPVLAARPILVPAPPAAAAVPAPAPAPPRRPAPPVETPEASLLGRIHDNWLEPAAGSHGVICRLRIDYLAGGHIATLKFLNPCGPYEMEESVRKAVYKSQPLPVLAAKTAPGFIVVEFRP